MRQLVALVLLFSVGVGAEPPAARVVTPEKSPCVKSKHLDLVFEGIELEMLIATVSDMACLRVVMPAARVRASVTTEGTEAIGVDSSELVTLFVDTLRLLGYQATQRDGELAVSCQGACTKAMRVTWRRTNAGRLEVEKR